LNIASNLLIFFHNVWTLYTFRTGEIMRRLLVVLLAALVVTSSALAEPYYSVLFGQSCFLCHQNPTGRGLRSTYGSQYFAPRYLPTWPPSDSMLAKFSPQLGSSVIIGADIREIWMSEDTPVPGQRGGLSAPFGTNTGTDANMNGTIYLAFQPTDYISLRYTQDLRNSLRYEAYGMVNGSLHKIPLHGYIKAGQFQENFGWAFSDHTAFVRTGLWEGYTGGVSGANPPTPPRYGAGGEVGLSGYHVTLTGSLTDDADAAFPPGPQDMPKRWVARAMVQQGVEKLGLEFTGGGSWRYEPSYGAASTRERWWGGFGGIGWQGMANTLGCKDGFGFLSTAALFEYDRKAWSPTWYPTAVTSAYSTTQLSIMVHPGVWVLGAYDWLDNTGLKDGNEAQRYSVGVQLFPWTWVDISPMYRLYKPVPMPGMKSRVRHGELQAHFQF
jgi:hypothetical protein